MRAILVTLILSTFYFSAFAQAEAENIAHADIQPEFDGGEFGFQNYLFENLIYPSYAADNGIDGEVYVKFIVDETGAVEKESVEVQIGVHPSIDTEAVRLIKESPNWIPGMNLETETAVRTMMEVPISFKLAKKKKKKRRK